MIKQYVKKTIAKSHKDKYKTLNVIEINQQNIINNYQVYRRLTGGKQLIAVLKANAYGHGLTQIATILNQTDCNFIAVDGYFEANKLLLFTKHKILVMGYILPDNAKLLDNKQCSYVVQDINGLKALGKLNKKFNIHLEINSGMNRLGLKPAELDSYLKTLKQYPMLKLEGVMSHLADADNPNNDFTLQQVAYFDEQVHNILLKGFRPEYIHLAQSAGATKANSKTANTIRIGIGLYGINPLSIKDKRYSSLNDLKPALELKSTIIKVINTQPGDKISYNGIYQSKTKEAIAVLPIGYYEWVPRELSNIGLFTDINYNYNLIIRGRVCMNHTMVDITTTKLNIGDKIILISNDNAQPNSIMAISQQFNLFSYNLLTRLSESIRRVIV